MIASPKNIILVAATTDERNLQRIGRIRVTPPVKAEMIVTGEVKGWVKVTAYLRPVTIGSAQIMRMKELPKGTAGEGLAFCLSLMKPLA